MEKLLVFPSNHTSGCLLLFDSKFSIEFFHVRGDQGWGRNVLREVVGGDGYVLVVSSFLLLIPFQLSLFRYFKGLSTKGYQWFLSRHLFSGFLVSTYVRFFLRNKYAPKMDLKRWRI